MIPFWKSAWMAAAGFAVCATAGQAASGSGAVNAAASAPPRVTPVPAAEAFAGLKTHPGLTYPSGVAVWRGGIFVTCAPDIYYLKDTDGDGVADVREVVLTGFSNRYTAHLRVSHPTVGLDGWVYLTSGLMGGKVIAPGRSAARVVEFSKNDSRFQPDTREFQLVSGHGQFGQTFDARGRKFVCMNRVPIQQVVFEERLLARNPLLDPLSTMTDIGELAANGRILPGGGTQLHPISDNIVNPRFPEHAGHYTAACGVLIYQGTALPAEYNGRVFVCEPVANLVHNDLLEARGTTFVSRPDSERGEFLASPDNWFRPVFLGHGPDGALYVVDMHRKTIEHPAYLPAEMRAGFDTASGRTAGRIFRVTAEHWRMPAAPRRMPADMNTAELVDCLNDADVWWRDTAHRLLIERADPGATALLRAALSAKDNTLARRRVLWLLEAFGRLESADVLAALADADAGVRSCAVRFAPRFFTASAGLERAVLAWARDADADVRLQVALAIGAMSAAGRNSSLAGIAADNVEDRWIRLAAWSSLTGEWGSFLSEFLELTQNARARAGDAYVELARLAGKGRSTGECRLLGGVALGRAGVPLEPWQRDALVALGAAFARRREPVGRVPALRAVLAGGASADRTLEQRLAEIADESARTAVDGANDVARRAQAVKLLALIDHSALPKVVSALLAPSQPQELQLAAVTSALMPGDRALVGGLLSAAAWRTYSPAVREALLGGIAGVPELVEELLAALTDSRMAARSVSPATRRALESHASADVGRRVKEIFAQAVPEDRQRVLAEYRKSLTLPARRENGRAVNERMCAACHRFGGAGGVIGPDLSGIGSQPVESTLQSILVPNQEIAHGYLTYQVNTREGHTYSGTLIAESAAAVTLRNPAGGTDTISRSQIASMIASDVSLMPDGLESGITQQEMADLLAYLAAGPTAVSMPAHP
ncbi:MAG: c-type cytochrome [Verrucomicrobia bacterium]|nr:c-type cytochrome [Verrucomicrobiota bacterium]